MEEYGIEETREVIKAFVSLANAIDSSTQDGFQLTDVLDYIKPLSLLPAAISNIGAVPLELFDLSEEERAIIKQDIEALEFASEYSELIAEQALKSVAEFTVLIVMITMARNKEAVQEILKIVEKIIK